jgi:hypothetical protein
LRFCTFARAVTLVDFETSRLRNRDLTYILRIKKPMIYPIFHPRSPYQVLPYKITGPHLNRRGKIPTSYKLFATHLSSDRTMGDNTQLQSTPAFSSQRPSNILRRSKKDETWEIYKEEIYRIYMKEDNTLKTTMQRIGPKLGFKAELVALCLPGYLSN